MTAVQAPQIPVPADQGSGAWRRRLLAYRYGLAGQTLSFAAMIAPIALRENGKLTSLVFTTAIATFLVNPAVLAYPYVFPVLRSERMARAASRVTLVVLVLVCLALLPFTATETRLGLPRGTFGVAAVLLAAQGLYLIALTRLVRSGDEARIGRARLYYGIAVLLFTGAALLPGTGVLSLTVANAAAFGVTAVALGLRPRRRTPGTRHPADGRLQRAYLRRSLRPTLSSAANGWAFFLPGLSLPGLGVAAAPWAVLNRICGGFATVLLTIVGPPLEAGMARAVRERDRAAFQRTRRQALLIGTAVALVALVTGVGLARYTSPDTASSWFWPVSVAALLFWVPLLALSPVNRLPNFLGRDVSRLVWDAARAVLMTAAFLATDGVTRLLVMGVVVSVFGAALLPMSRYRGVPR